MNIMDTMERTLQESPAQALPTAPPGKMRWLAEFKEPIDAALHQGTSPPSKEMGRTISTSDLHFFD